MEARGRKGVVSRKALRIVFLCAGMAGCTAAWGQGVDDTWRDLLIQAQHAAGAGDYFKAEEIFLKALHEAGRFGDNDNRVATTWTSLGLAYKSAKRFPEAESAFRKALRIVDWGDSAETVDVADINFSLGSVIVRQGRYAEALPLFGRSSAAYARLTGGKSLQVASVDCAVGEAYRLMKSWHLAADALKRCADIREADGGILNADLGDVLYSLALVYQQEGQYALADPRFKLAEKIREKIQGIMSPGFADVLESHSALLKTMGREKESARDAALAAAIRRHHPPLPGASGK